MLGCVNRSGVHSLVSQTSTCFWYRSGPTLEVYEGAEVELSTNAQAHRYEPVRTSPCINTPASEFMQIQSNATRYQVGTRFPQ